MTCVHKHFEMHVNFGIFSAYTNRITETLRSIWSTYTSKLMQYLSRAIVQAIRMSELDFRDDKNYFALDFNFIFLLCFFQVHQ